MKPAVPVDVLSEAARIVALGLRRAAAVADATSKRKPHPRQH